MNDPIAEECPRCGQMTLVSFDHREASIEVCTNCGYVQIEAV